jgi:hypothetical protein
MPSKALGDGAAPTRRQPRATLAPVKDDNRFSLEESRFVRSAWVWRAFLLLSLMAIGVAIIFAGNGKTLDAVLWVVIAVGWGAFAIGLWRKHTLLTK